MSALAKYEPAWLSQKSRELDSATPEQVLAFAFATYPELAISTAFGLEGCALIDMAVKIQPRVRVFTVDTDYLFPETLALHEQLQKKYDLNVTVLKPLLTISQQTEQRGPNLYESDPDQCCNIRKVEPTRRAIAGLDAWIAGLRRDQAKTRDSIDVFERYDHPNGQPYVKVHPLANWTRKDTWSYVVANGVPYNVLLDRGYKSVGCWPCTRPVAEHEDERAGRWAGQQKTECGIHSFAVKKQ